MKRSRNSPGFTIVELLIVIVIIGILATIVVVDYLGVTDKAHDAVLQSDVDNASTLLEVYRINNHKYPTDPTLANDGKALPASNGNTISYNVSTDNKNYCVAATRDGVSYYKSSKTDKIESGDCGGVSFMTPIQAITTATCPTDRTAVVDARDRHTYWIQKLADGKCWMLTNLAYAGGGSSTYGDTKALSNGSSDGSANYYDQAKYYIPSGSNATTEPTNPSISTLGGISADSAKQYGYLYNWCAAMGAQTGTSACANAIIDNWNHGVSICPSGWHLPTSNGGGYRDLFDATEIWSYDAITSVWLAQMSGWWNSGLGLQGFLGVYWASNQSSATSANLVSFDQRGSSLGGDQYKYTGMSVRCVAAI